MKLPIERLLNKVKKTEGCWIWIGAKKPTGYGNFFMNGKHIGAHCASYVLHIGEIDKGKIVCHTCDNPSCINPSHLFLGTPKDNMGDMIHKGRAKGIAQGKEMHPNSKLTSSDVYEIRKRRELGHELLEIAKDYGVTAASKYWHQINAIIEEYKNAQEPFGYFKAEPFGWTDCAETEEGAKALYEHPPLSDETVKDAERYKFITENKHVPWGSILQKYEVHEIGIDAAIDEAMKAKA